MAVLCRPADSVWQLGLQLTILPLEHGVPDRPCKELACLAPDLSPELISSYINKDLS